MENLEELDNKTLHAKCLEYGLPNIPITDTSRKLFIKRLRAAIESGVKPVAENKITAIDKPKTRRETIQVNKSETPTKEEQRTREKSKSPSRRRTVDVAVAPTSGKASPAPAAVPAQITQRRRSGRTTPSKQAEPVISEPVKNKIKSTTVIEEETDLILIEDDDSRPPSRQSRASSLSVSPTVTTTYTRETIVEAKEQEDEEEPYEPRFTQKSAYICGDEEYFTIPSTTTNLQKEPLYTSSRINPTGFSRPSLVSTAPKIISYEPISTIDSSSNINRRYTSIGGTRDITTSSSTYRPGRTSTYQHLIREDSGSDENEVDSPYLSDFSRRLSKLKDQTIDGGVSTLRRELSQQKDLPFKRASIKYNDQRLLRGQQDSVNESLKQLWFALDHKYGLKNKLYITGGIMLLFCVFVLFYK